MQVYSFSFTCVLFNFVSYDANIQCISHNTLWLHCGCFPFDFCSRPQDCAWQDKTREKVWTPQLLKKKVVVWQGAFNPGMGTYVAQWFESRNSNPKTLGSIPWWGRMRNIIFRPSESTLVQTCVCLTPTPFPLPCVRHAPKLVRMLKIPHPSVVKE